MSSARHSPCPLCGNASTAIVYPALKEKEENTAAYAPSASGREQGAIVRCLRCSVVYKDPFPPEKTLKEGYEESIDEQYLALLPERRATFAHELRFIERYKQGGRLLDVGCAEGTLLTLAREHGWHVTGVEPNKHFIRWAKKNYHLSILQGSVFNKKLKKNSFDVITLLDVIEHVSDPRRFLWRCHELLAPGGMLFISTPDIGSIIARLMRRRWFYILSIHVFYFTQQTLGRLLSQVSFQEVESCRYLLRTRLSYVAEKSRNYLGVFGTVFHTVVWMLGLGDKEVTYWLGQRMFVAKKPTIEDFEKPQSPLSNRFENPRRTSKLEGYSKLSIRKNTRFFK